MKFKKLVAVSCLALSGITPTLAEETTYGIGVAVNSYGFEGGTGIYFPITMGDLLIEPSINMYSYEDTFKNTSGTSNYEYDFMEIGVGVFKNENVDKNVSLYYGARLSYLSGEDSSSSSTSKSTSDYDGYTITPTIGMQYHFNKHFSLGLDAGYRFSDYSSESKSTSTPKSTSDITQQTTVSSILIRYHF